MVYPGHHRALGAEVLHQPQRLVGDETLELRHDFHVGSAEAVNGLLWIPDYKQLSGLEYRFSQPGRFALISIDYAAPAPADVYVDFVLVPEAGSLDELKQSGGGTYFYDDGAQKLWILPVLGGTGTSLLDGTQTTVVALSGA